MRFQISLKRQTILLKDRGRVPDGVIDLSGTVDHLVRQVGCLELQRFSYRSAMPLIITGLVENSMFASDVQPLSIGGEQRMHYDLEVRLAGAILQARLLQLTNGDDGFNSPQDAVNAAFSPEYLAALREQLRIVAYHLSDPKKSVFVADIDLSSCSVISGALATNAFAEDDDDVERIFFDEKTPRQISFKDLLNSIEKDEDENQYDDEDWRAWWDNNEPPFGKDK